MTYIAEYSAEQRHADRASHALVERLLGLVLNRALTAEALEELIGLINMTLFEFADTGAGPALRGARHYIAERRDFLLSNTADGLPDELGVLLSVFAATPGSRIELSRQMPLVRLDFAEYQASVMQYIDQMKQQQR